MALKDSDPDKWVYSQHTRVKHEILSKYLWAWIRILWKWHKRICYFDTFAGRGEYVVEGEPTPGSPVIALRLADEYLERSKEDPQKPMFAEFVCFLIEKDPDNFRNLESVVTREQTRLKNVDACKVDLRNQEFAPVVHEILQNLRGDIAPSFFFIDPFGFKGVPFDLVKKILSMKRTEVFFTFMTRDINRFLGHEDLSHRFDELFGTSDWRRLLERCDPGKQHQTLRDFYIRRLKEDAKVKHAWAFRVCTDDRCETLYYLIHATNHFRGLKIMKDIMHKQGPKGMFAYLGPEDVYYRNQLRLFEEDSGSLKEYLVRRFSGRTVRFMDIIEESYEDTPVTEPQYRKALKELEKDEQVRVARFSSETARGLSGSDSVTFPEVANTAT